MKILELLRFDARDFEPLADGNPPSDIRKLLKSYRCEGLLGCASMEPDEKELLGLVASWVGFDSEYEISDSVLLRLRAIIAKVAACNCDAEFHLKRSQQPAPARG